MIVTTPLDDLRRRSGRKWSQVPDDVLPAWIADMDLAPAPAIARALAEALALGDFGYGPAAARSGVPEAFAVWAERRWGWCIDPADILLMPDVVGGIANCIEALTAPDDAILVHVPAYPPLPASVETAGRRLVAHPLAEGDVDFAALEGTIAAEGVRMLLFCHPHNPTGRVFTAAELNAFAAIARRHHLVIVSDEVHADLTLPGHRHRPFARFAPERTVTLNAPSKAFNVAGLRLAVCHAPEPLRARLAALPPTRWNAFSALGVRAALAAWSEEGEQWLTACLAHLERQRDRVGLWAKEHGVGLRSPAASYLAWLDFRQHGLSEPAAFLLDRARVMLSPGRDFRGPEPGFARLNFATSEEILSEILDRMSRALG